MAFMNARKRNKKITYIIVALVSAGLLITTIPSIGSFVANNSSYGTSNARAVSDFQAGMDLVQRGKDKQAEVKFDAAIKGFEETLKADPENLQVLGDLATAHFYRGNVDKAIELAKQALEIEPKYTNVRRNYAIYLFYGKNDPVEALKQLDMIEKGDVNYESAQQLKAGINAELMQPPPKK